MFTLNTLVACSRINHIDDNPLDSCFILHAFGYTYPDINVYAFCEFEQFANKQLREYYSHKKSKLDELETNQSQYNKQYDLIASEDSEDADSIIDTIINAYFDYLANELKALRWYVWSSRKLEDKGLYGRIMQDSGVAELIWNASFECD